MDDACSLCNVSEFFDKKIACSESLVFFHIKNQALAICQSWRWEVEVGK
jgi:hypothetical protein